MTQLPKILIAFGTRPEAIKMAPVAKTLQASGKFDVRVCVTGQHREMIDAVLPLFDLKVDHDLAIMRSGQDLTDITSRVLYGMRDLFSEYAPDLVMVHGDTTTTLSVSLASYYKQIPVAHVEAGLRTGNIYAPWPEEINRRLTGAITALHFAPTAKARDNLLAESIATDKIFVTGNTVIDALLQVRDRISQDTSAFEKQFGFLDPKKRLILVTGHRRENFGDGFLRIVSALRRLSEEPDVQIVYPVHLNPSVQKPVREGLGSNRNVHLIEPLDYLSFVYLVMKSYIILTDSGGVQEEAPSLGKPVIVLRDTTERPEAVDAGTVKLAGTDEDKIVGFTRELLNDSKTYLDMSNIHNPYGDGLASGRILKALKEYYGAN